MPFTGDVLTALTGGTLAGLTGSCWVEFLDGWLPGRVYYGCERASVRDSSLWVTSAAARWPGWHRFPINKQPVGWWNYDRQKTTQTGHRRYRQSQSSPAQTFHQECVVFGQL